MPLVFIFSHPPLAAVYPVIVIAVPSFNVVNALYDVDGPVRTFNTSGVTPLTFAVIVGLRTVTVAASALIVENEIAVNITIIAIRTEINLILLSIICSLLSILIMYLPMFSKFTYNGNIIHLLLFHNLQKLAIASPR
jgi:hypothetical protein